MAIQLDVMCSGGFIEAFQELVPAFERRTGLAIKAVQGSSIGKTLRAIPVRLRGGESADVVILFEAAVDELISEGLILPASKRSIAASGIGLAVKVGAPSFDIGSAHALRRALLAAKSVGYSSSASGIYVSTELFGRLGISEELGPKSRRIENERVGDVVARGEVEIGFQQMSELLATAGITVLGPIPAEVQQFTVLSAAIPLATRQPEAARSLIAHVASPLADEILKRNGLSPFAR